MLNHLVDNIGIGVFTGGGRVVDGLYLALGLSAAATLGEVAETLPEWLLLAATVVLLLLTLPALFRWTGRLVPAAG